jgi:biopolymer transport protein ExbB/TolQ
VESFRQGSGPLNYIFASLLKRYETLVLENRTDTEDMRQELITVTEESGVEYLGRWLSALGTIGVIAPLIGLLGTITGLINSFEAIARSGAGDPAAVAIGISQALLTTATGLIVALPPLYFIVIYLDVRIEPLKNLNFIVMPSPTRYWFATKLASTRNKRKENTAL